VRGRKQFVFRDFSKGVAYNYDEAYSRLVDGYVLDGPYARNCENVVATPYGSVRRRNGCKTWATLSAPNGLFVADVTAGQFLLTVDAGTLKKADATAATGSFSSIQGALPAFTAIKPPSMVKGSSGAGSGSFIYGQDGLIAFTWSGTGNAAVWTASSGTLPKGEQLLYAGSRMFIGNVTNDGSGGAHSARLHWSNPGNPFNWLTAAPYDAGFVDIDPEDGPITGLARVGAYILVFKANRIYLVYDLDTGANRQVSNLYGCIDPASIVNTPLGVVFFSNTHELMVTDGNSIRALSQQIQPLLRTVPTFNGPVSCGFLNNRLYLGLTNTPAGTNSDHFEYDVANDAWWPHNLPGGGMTALASFQGGQGATPPLGVRPVLFGTNAVKIFKLFLEGETNDDGSAFGYSWQSPWHTFGQPHAEKIVREVRADVAGASLQLDLVKTFLDSPQGQTTIQWEAETAYTATERRFYTPGHGRAWSVQVAHDPGVPADDDFELMSYLFSIDYRQD